MRHRRVGRFVAGHFNVPKRVNRQAFPKFYSFRRMRKGRKFEETEGAGLDGLHFRDYLCPATE